MSKGSDKRPPAITAEVERLRHDLCFGSREKKVAAVGRLKALGDIDLDYKLEEVDV